jgi:GNAT superfamily N-acetyltransferase
MTRGSPALRRIAHDALSLTEAAYLRHYRRGRFRLWNGVGLTASELPGPGFCFAACLGPCPPLVELLPVAREFFADCEKGWGVQVEADAGHPVEAEVKARGWAVEEDEPALVIADIAAALASGGRKPPVDSRDESRAMPTGGSRPPLALRVARTRADEAAYERVTVAAFAPPPELADGMKPATSYIGDPDIGLVVGSVEGEDASVAGFSISGTTAVLWGVATLEAHRGKGYGAAVIRAALAEAAARGCTSACLRSGPKSVPLYERVGFVYACNHRTYAAPPDPAK